MKNNKNPITNSIKSTHNIYYSDARKLKGIDDKSVHLVVTSPPYPMISMWDEMFSNMNNMIKNKLENNQGDSAFNLMHKELDKVWEEIYRVLVPGGFFCINIGDATRTLNKRFKLYPNHTRILMRLSEIGFDILPEIIWRKPTNSPTKFLGSGMLPAGAYVTLEHEYILIFRKPLKRIFSSETEREERMRSSFFWEERNKWFSDLWELNGKRQDLNSKDIRKRSGAFPFEIPFRLINMFSKTEDTVLDPFLGTATTTLASICLARNSIGIESDQNFDTFHNKEICSEEFLVFANSIIQNRVEDHKKFINQLVTNGKNPKYSNKIHMFPVVTRQETKISIYSLSIVKQKPKPTRKSRQYIAEHNLYKN